MNKKWMHTLIVLGILIVVVFVGACSAKTPTPDLAKVSTMIAQTVAVQQTRTEIARPTNTATKLPEPTSTPVPPTQTIAPTSVQPTEVTSTNLPISGTDAGVWVASSPADQTAQNLGQTFIVKVKLMNTGTSTWSTGYSIRYVSGDITGLLDTYYMAIPVPPGSQIEIDVSLKAPSKTGMFRGDWAIYNSANKAFSSFYFEYDIK